MKTIALLAALGIVAAAGIILVRRMDPERIQKLAEDELYDLKDHFKSLDAVAANS